MGLLAIGCNDQGLVKDGPPRMRVEPSQIDFGTVVIGEEPVRSITITNVAGPGSASLTIVDVRPEDDPRIVLDEPLDLPLTVPPQGSVTVSIRFVPDTHLLETAARVVVEPEEVESAEVDVAGAGLLCEALDVLKVQDWISPTATVDLIEQNGVDPEFDLYYAPTYKGAVRFSDQKIGCVWVEPGTTWVGFSGTADTQGPWGVDNAIVVEFYDLEENHLGWTSGGDGDLEAVRHLPTGELLPSMATASVQGQYVNVPDNPYGLYGFPSRGSGAFNLLPFFAPNEPVIFRFNTLDEGAVASVTDLYLFADP